MSKYCFFTIFSVLFYGVLAFWFSPGMFDGGQKDGFYSQIIYFHNNYEEFRVLWFVHFLRYVIAYPFWWLHINGFESWIQSVVYLAFVLPLLLQRLGGSGDYIKALLLFLPFFISYRSALVVVSLTIVFQMVYFGKGGGWGFIVSALLANLSSGVVLAWLLLCFFYRRKLVKRRAVFLIPMAVVFLSLSLSVMNKIDYFDFAPFTMFEKVGGEYVINENLNGALLGNGTEVVVKRSSLYVYAKTGNWRKLSIYIGLFVLLACSLVIAFFKERYISLFFLVGVVGFLVEGLWVVAFVMPTIMYIGHVCFSKFQLFILNKRED